MRISRTFFERVSNQRGSLITSLLATVAIGGVIAGILLVSNNLQKASFKQIADARMPVTVASSVESVLLAFRLAEMHYIQTGTDCSAGVQPFMSALHYGHGCLKKIDGSDFPESISVFRSEDASIIGIPTPTFFSYSQATCVIHRSGPMTCGNLNLPIELFSIGYTDPTQIINRQKFKILLRGVDPKRSLGLFRADMTDPDNKTESKNFALTNSLLNTAHIEADGRVTQAKPDPLSFCPGEPWAKILTFNRLKRQCSSFAEMGSGTGLAYYAGNFFGFRPADGQVIHLLEGANANPNSYLVDEGGHVSGTSDAIFPPYSKESLTNVDDITVIGSQIYFIAQSGDSALIGAVAPSSRYKSDSYDAGAGGDAYSRISLCALGKQGWSQAYSGVAATGWSDPLLPESGSDQQIHTGLMFAKTDSGDLLSVLFLVKPDTGAAVNCTEPQKFKVDGAPFVSCCYVSKDSNLQVTEYQRTYGFDRADPVRPFYLQ